MVKFLGLYVCIMSQLDISSRYICTDDIHVTMMKLLTNNDRELTHHDIAVILATAHITTNGQTGTPSNDFWKFWRLAKNQLKNNGVLVSKCIDDSYIVTYQRNITRVHRTRK